MNNVHDNIDTVLSVVVNTKSGVVSVVRVLSAGLDAVTVGVVASTVKVLVEEVPELVALSQHVTFH
jgi:hypothetical protein